MKETAPRPESSSAVQLQAVLRDFLEQTSGCAMCELLSRLAYSYVIRFGTAGQAERSQFPGFPPGMGLCNWHFWELDRSFESPQFSGKLLDILTLLPTDLGLVGAELGSLEQLPLSRDRCWVCQELERDEAGYVSQLAGLLERVVLRDAYEKSFGLCFPHVYAVAQAATPQVRAWLLRVEGAHWLRLKHELSELQRKWNPELRGQVTPRESTSPRRCVEKLVGQPGWQWPTEIRVWQNAAAQ